MEGGLRICCEVTVAVVVVVAVVALTIEFVLAAVTAVAEAIIAELAGVDVAETLNVSGACASAFIKPAAFTAEAKLIGAPPRACACAS